MRNRGLQMNSKQDKAISFGKQKSMTYLLQIELQHTE